MTAEEKVQQLRDLVYSNVVPLIDRDYVLFGLPYHNNIGDTLIWEGELVLLHTLPYRCLHSCGFNSYPDKPLKNKGILILVHGGGYIGDVWRKGWQQVLDCMRMNPDNKIVVLPNTVHYDDKSLIAADAEILARCRDLTLCLRDSRSLRLAREYFPTVRSILVPDMAFCIEPAYLKKWAVEPVKDTLLLKRLDKELSGTVIPAAVARFQPEVHDWPTLERLIPEEKWFQRVRRRAERLGKRVPRMAPFTDWLYRVWYRPLMTATGIRFVSSYRRIYTTRLHVMILSVLLGREVHLIDNSYGKLSTFYHTWLEDCCDTYVCQE